MPLVRRGGLAREVVASSANQVDVHGGPNAERRCERQQVCLNFIVLIGRRATLTEHSGRFARSAHVYVRDATSSEWHKLRLIHDAVVSAVPSTTTKAEVFALAPKGGGPGYRVLHGSWCDVQVAQKIVGALPASPIPADFENAPARSCSCLARDLNEASRAAGIAKIGLPENLFCPAACGIFHAATTAAVHRNSEKCNRSDQWSD